MSQRWLRAMAVASPPEPLPRWRRSGMRPPDVADAAADDRVVVDEHDRSEDETRAHIGFLGHRQEQGDECVPRPGRCGCAARRRRVRARSRMPSRPSDPAAGRALLGHAHAVVATYITSRPRVVVTRAARPWPA